MNAGAGAGESGVPPRGTDVTPAPEAVGGRSDPAPADRAKDDLIVNICGALTSCINDHGPITKQSVFSAAKRVAGQLANLPPDTSPSIAALLGYETGVEEGRHQAAEFALECAAEWDKTYAEKAAEAARYIASKLKEKAGP